MFQLNNYLKPTSIEEAYEILQNSRNNVILGGNTFLKLSSKKYNVAIDLSNLELNNIVERETEYELGAYVTYGDIGRFEAFNTFADGALIKCTENIVGSQFRNHVTVGASVYSKYGFSDFIPTLLVLNASVLLHKNGKMSLEEFLSTNIKKDILLKIFIPKEKINCSFKSLRSTKTDFSIVNVAVSKRNSNYLVSVGARPGLAVLCHNTSKYLSENNRDSDISRAREILFEEVSFSSNAKASGEYRKKLAGNLFKRAILELEDNYES